MSRYCIVTHKGVMAGNNVSHAKNRTRRRFLPNLQHVSLYSEALKASIPMRISMHGMRTIEHAGGIDGFVMQTSSNRLEAPLQHIKKKVQKALEGLSA